jgi:hypothetical protein
VSPRVPLFVTVAIVGVALGVWETRGQAYGTTEHASPTIRDLLSGVVFESPGSIRTDR